MTPTERLLTKFPDAKQVSGGWSAPCPAHEDGRASLSIGEGDDGRALVHCHAGCTVEAICAAVNLRVADLMPANRSTPAKSKHRESGKIVATYQYTDEAGKLLYESVRYKPKDFRQRQPKPGGGWIWNLKGVRLVPYELPFLVHPENAGATILICEGEKDVDSLKPLGLLATCNPMGAGKWRDDYSRLIAESAKGGKREVVLFPDNDEPGRKHMNDVCRSLMRYGCEVTICKVPIGKDVSDWIEAGATLEDVKKLVKAASPVKECPPVDPKDDGGDTNLPEVVLPDGPVTISQTSRSLAELMSATGKFFRRGGIPMRAAHDDQGEWKLDLLKATTAASDFEQVARLVKVKMIEGEPENVPAICSESMARMIVASASFANQLPAISLISRSPVLIEREGQLRVITGYDRDSGIMAGGEPPEAVSLDEARSLLQILVKDFQFATPGDRSRAIAGFITPPSFMVDCLAAEVQSTLVRPTNPRAVRGTAIS